MSLASRMRAAFAGFSGKAATSPSSYVMNMGTPTWTAWNFQAYANEAYGQNPYVYRAITVLADAAAGVGWLLYQQQGDNYEEMPDDHKLMQLIHRPNEQQGTAEWMRELVCHLYISGEGFVRGVGPETRNGPPVIMYNLRPDLVAVIAGDSKSDPVKGYIYQGSKGREDIPAGDVGHFKFFNPLDDLRGLSPLSACSRSIDVNNEGRKLNKALLEHGGVPGLVVYMEGGTESDAEKLLERLNKRSGASQAGRNIVLPKTQKVDKTSWSPADMQWANGLQISAREIAAALGVPSGLLGDMAEKTYAKLRSERASLYQETVLPLLDHIRDELNRWLSPQFGPGLVLQYDRDSIEALSEEQTSMWVRIVQGFQSGLLSVDEAREALGYEELGGEIGASRFTQMPMVPLEMGAAPGTPAETE